MLPVLAITLLGQLSDWTCGDVQSLYSFSGCCGDGTQNKPVAPECTGPAEMTLAEMDSRVTAIRDNIASKFTHDADGSTMAEFQGKMYISGSNGFSGMMGEFGTSNPNITAFKTIGKFMKYDSSKSSGAQTVNFVEPRSTHRVDVMSISKTMTGLAFVKVMKLLDSTSYELVMNMPINGPSGVIPALRNVKYVWLRKTGGTEKFTVLPNSNAHSGEPIVRLTSGAGEHPAGTLLPKSTADGLQAAYTDEIGYEAVEQSVTIADCLAEVAGQGLMHLPHWREFLNDRNGAPFEYTEMLDLLYATGHKLPTGSPPPHAGSVAYPDAHGLAYVNTSSTDPVPPKTVYLTSSVGASGYGRGINVVGYYIIQQLRAKELGLSSSEVVVLQSPFDMESVMYKWIFKPLGLDSRITLRRHASPLFWGRGASALNTIGGVGVRIR